MAYIGLSPVVGEFKKLDDISSQFNNSTSTFNLTVAGDATIAGSAQNLIISIDGVIQEPQASYTVGGSQITFTEAPNTASTFFGIQLGSVAQIGVAGDDTISTVKIQNSAVTAAKIADGAITEAKIATDAVSPLKILPNTILRGTTTFMGGSIERANIVASSVTSNVNLDPQVSGIVYFTGNSTSNANVTVNFLNQSSVAVGNVSSFVLIITNNTDNKAVVTSSQIEGAAGNVIRYIGGTPSGTANIDVYSFSVIKTAASTYSILGSKSNFF